jgi:Bacterial membrane protein YfhO
MQSAVFDPLLLAVNLHPTPLTWDLSIIGAFVLGAAAAYLFGRILGLGVVPSVVTTAAFSLSGWFFLYSNNSFCRSYAYLPLLFLLVELVLRSRRLLPVLGLGVAIAGNIYIGMPEASFLVIGSAAAYAVVRLVQERRRMPFLVSLVRLGGAGLLGVMLAAPLVLLFLEYEPLSFNIHRPEFDVGTVADPQWGLLNWLVPFFAEDPPVGYGSTVRNWFGVAVGISALAAMSGRTETKRLHTWLFVALGGALLLKIYEFRVFDRVGRLPVLELIVFPTFAAAVVSFAFAVLAGIGVQVVWSRDLRLWRFLTLVATALMLLAVFARTGDAPRDYAASVWGRGLLVAVLAVIAVVLAARFGRRWAALLLAGLIVAELFVLAPFDIYARRADPYRTPGWMPLVRTAQESAPHSRVFAIDAKLYPNTAGALGLQDVRALDALYPKRYLEYVRTFIAPNVFDRFTGTEPPILIRNNPMFDVLSPRVVLSVSDLSGVPGLRLLGRDGDTRVYENTEAYPRAWVVHDVYVVGGVHEALAFLRARSRQEQGAFVVDSFDPRHEAVVEHGEMTDDALRKLTQGSRCAARERGRVTAERYTAESVSLRVDTPCAGLLVLPDTYFPGWTATVNGRERPIYATDAAFRGVTVREGTSRVEFRYEPRAFSLGIVIALVGLAAFVLLALVGWWRTRKRRSPVAGDGGSPTETGSPALRPSDLGP